MKSFIIVVALFLGSFDSFAQVNNQKDEYLQAVNKRGEKIVATLGIADSQIAPNQIGKFGQLQEWLEDKDDTSNKHRHVSHLWGVHPGNDINWDKNPDLVKAARQSLIYRGDAGTGWSLAWKINFWSRFKDGDHAFRMIKMLISPASKGGGSYVNLFDAHPPFQIDGNFGGAAGIGEMLVQSHAGYIDLLPALPSDFQEGDIKGFCAGGGFEVHMTWVKYKNKKARLKTQKGKRYKLDNQLKVSG